MRTILSLGPKGGCGKSSMVRNLAAAAVLEGLGVATLDTDPQGTVARWHQKRQRTSAPTIAGFSVDLREAVAAVASARGPDLLLVDTPTAVEVYPEAIKALIMAADFVVIPTQPLPDDVDSVRELMSSVVRDLGRPAMFVVNRVKPRIKEVERARGALGRWGDVAAAMIPDSIDVVRAMSAGLGVIETGGKGGVEFRDVWHEIGRRMGDER
jgi:chromosome partitioning protein